MDFIVSIDSFIKTASEYSFISLMIGALVAWFGYITLRTLIRKFFIKTDFIEDRREKTIETLVISIIKYSALIGYVFFALSLFIHDFSRLLAGAGIAGIILGIGAQSIIKDIFTGIFMIYEKQMHTGDFVTINGKYSGTVEDFGIRFTKIREWSGKLLTISNGVIKELHNYNVNYMRVIERIVTSFYENPNEVFNVLQKACDRLNENFCDLLKKDENSEYVEKYQVHGMSPLNTSHRGYEYLVTAVVNDDVFWEATKQVRKIIAQTMYEENITMAEENVNLNHLRG